MKKERLKSLEDWYNNYDNPSVEGHIKELVTEIRRLKNYYIVKWLDKEHHFTDAREALICAENVANTNQCNSYVFVESMDGVREEEPLFRCELEI